ncbi:hypothetical protein IWW47_003459, partial [Coemansia sp. RSA 2052]
MTNATRKYTTPRKEASTSPRKAGGGSRDTHAVYTTYASTADGAGDSFRAGVKPRVSPPLPQHRLLSEEGARDRASSSQMDDLSSVGGMAALSDSQKSEDSSSSDSVLERVPGGRVLDLHSLPPPDKMLSQFNPQLR